MNAQVLRRGDGVGIEVTARLVRGVRLDEHHDGRVTAAGEVAIADITNDRAVVNALVRLRADLGDPVAATRVATFPPASTLQRLDATGLTGAELNAMRASIEQRWSVGSTLLVDDGPRRWLMAIRWDEASVRRIESLAERAGFADATVEPSPICIARVVAPEVTRIRRDSATDESFELLTANGQPVAATAVDSVGRSTPALVLGTTEFSSSWFDDFDNAVDLTAELLRFVDNDDRRAPESTISIAGTSYPPFPPHDLRAPERQCVALGAAVGAAGLAGRLRPVDMVVPARPATDATNRPWAIERVSELPPHEGAVSLGPGRRLLSRLIPRRWSRDRSTG